METVVREEQQEASRAMAIVPNIDIEIDTELYP